MAKVYAMFCRSPSLSGRCWRGRGLAVLGGQAPVHGLKEDEDERAEQRR